MVRRTPGTCWDLQARQRTNVFADNSNHTHTHTHTKNNTKHTQHTHSQQHQMIKEDNTPFGQPTLIVLFLDSASIMKQKASNSSLAFPCCQQQWSPALLHMKCGRHNGMILEWNLMGLTHLLVVHHINLCNMCRENYKTGITLSHINDTQNKGVYTTQVHTSVHVYCAHAAGVSRESTKCIRQAANNAGQPCQWPSHQIHRISRETPLWTTDQNRLQGARLCARHHQSQRGGPPSWGTGIQQREDDCPQHTRERHFIVPAMNGRTSSQQITTCTYVHTWLTVDNSMHPYQTPCQGAYNRRTAIHTTKVHKHTTIFNIEIQH